MKTIAIDTNTLLHYRLKREPHFKEIRDLFERCLQGKVEIFIPQAVFLETEWVLRSYYEQPKEQIIRFFHELLSIDDLIVSDKKELELSLNLYNISSGVSFTDCLIINQVQNFECDEFLTFDRNLKRLYKEQ